MLFTVGRTKIYHARHEVWGRQKKTGRLDSPFAGYEGGCVFQTVEDAARYVRERCIGEEEKFTAFGLANTIWGVDTIPSEDGWWHHLLWSRPILLPEEIDNFVGLTSTSSTP